MLYILFYLLLVLHVLKKDLPVSPRQVSNKLCRARCFAGTGGRWEWSWLDDWFHWFGARYPFFNPSRMATAPRRPDVQSHWPASPESHSEGPIPNKDQELLYLYVPLKTCRV